MNRRTTGVLVAIAAVVTSLIVLLRLEKPRRYLQARFQQVRGVLLGQKQVQRAAGRIATRLSHLTHGAKGTTEQTITRMKQTGSDLAEKAKHLTAVGSQNGR